MTQLTFWDRWLLIASVLFALQGITWIVFGSFDPFGIYHHWMAEALLEEETISDQSQRVFQYAVGLLGATNTGFFVLFSFIVRYPYANRERWAHVALTSGLVAWFVLDSSCCLLLGAWFNVLLVNMPCLLVLGIPLTATAREFGISRSKK